MKTITTDVFTYDELDAEAQEKAREWYRDGNDYYFLQEYMQDTLSDLLKESAITCEKPRVLYSLSNCQGDGAMWEGTAYWGEYVAKIKQSGHYYHYNSKDIELYKIVDGQQVDASADDEEAFNTLYVNICKKLERAGYDYIENEDAEETVVENIRANEYTFTKDGKRFA